MYEILDVFVHEVFKVRRMRKWIHRIVGGGVFGNVALSGLLGFLHENLLPDDSPHDKKNGRHDDETPKGVEKQVAVGDGHGEPGFLRQAFDSPEQLDHEKDGDQPGSPPQVKMFNVQHVVMQHDGVSPYGDFQDNQQNKGGDYGEDLHNRIYYGPACYSKKDQSRHKGNLQQQQLPRTVPVGKNQRNGKYHVAAHNHVIVENKQRVDIVGAGHVLACRHQKVVEEPDGMQYQHRREDTLVLEGAVMTEHKEAKTEQHGLCEAGNQTKQQQVKKITVHSGKDRIKANTVLLQVNLFQHFFLVLPRQFVGGGAAVGLAVGVDVGVLLQLLHGGGDGLRGQ